MTPKEELNYLIDLVIESGKWERSEGETKSSMELEIRLRIERLMNGQEVTQSQQDTQLVTNNLSTPRPSRAGMVQITLPGRKKKWVRLDWTEEVPCKCSRTGFKRVVKDEYRSLVPGMESIPDVDAGSL